jgi:uncharacterized membrane-anchored protein
MMKKQHEIHLLGTMLVAVPIALLDAEVTMYGWNTFVVSAFHVPAIRLINTLGLLMLFNYLITKKSDFDSTESATWEQLLSATLTTLLTWLVMFVLHFFI